jgi:hypothetical protein
MGQTLTHGVYLPDEGERNCYSGLAANWQLLDNSVGTIAEHTTALAGKAPAVHTHTKSDVTDLFNSANEWSALNTYSNGQIRIKSQSQERGVIPSSNVIQYLEFADKNDAQHGIVGLWDYSNGASEIQMYITDKFKNGAKDPTGTSETTILSFGFKTDGSKFLTFSGQVDNSVIPKTNNTYDLGSSSYQWNNVYSKGYYYNGTPWGLDKSNEWSVNQYYTGMMILNSSSDVVEQFRQKLPKDVSTSSDALVRFNTLVDSAGHNVVVEAVGHWANYVSKSISLKYKNDSTKQGTINFRLESSGHGLFYPESSFECDLGNSYNKWKSLNGINPGALSLPDSSKSVTIDTTGYTDSNNFYWTPSSDGWLFVSISHCSIASIKTQIGEYYINQSSGWYRNTVPVAKNKQVTLMFVCSSSDIPTLTFYPCQGNV